jgi:protein gp37
MGENSKIEWTDHTFNAWWGCTKVSAGCDHCYAERLDGRFGGEHWGHGAPRKVMSDAYWRQPLKWDRDAAASGERRRVFAGSMCDVFDNEAPAGQFLRLMDVIYRTPNLDWLLLTKRPSRIIPALKWAHGEYLTAVWHHLDVYRFLYKWLSGTPPNNVWIGTSCENQATADTRIPALINAPAALRFLSLEPLLGPIDIRPWLLYDQKDSTERVKERQRAISLVIVGGESGPGARPMHPDWARSLRDQCTDADVPFFFKQWGHWAPENGDNFQKSVSFEKWSSARSFGPSMAPVGKRAAGRLLDGRTWDGFPETQQENVNQSG